MCHGSVEGYSQFFSKLMASDDVPVCSRRSWPWRAGSRAGSLHPVVLVAFTNVILTARRTSRLSDRWLLSKLWATTCHSERRQNNNYNINLVVKIVEGSRRIPGRGTTWGWVWGLKMIPGLPIRCTPDRLNLPESKGTRVFIAFWGRGVGPWHNDGACASHNYSSTWNSTHARLSTVPCAVRKPLHRTSRRSDQRKELWGTTSAHSTMTHAFSSV